MNVKCSCSVLLCLGHSIQYILLLSVLLRLCAFYLAFSIFFFIIFLLFTVVQISC